MDFSTHKTRQKQITHAMAVTVFTIATTITAAWWSIWVGLLEVAGVTVFVLTLLKPSWFFTIIYPPLIMVGQLPLTIGEMTVSLERALVVVGGMGLVGGIFVIKRLQLHAVSKTVLFGALILVSSNLVAMVLSPSEQGGLVVLGLIQRVVLGYFVFISFREPKEILTVFRVFLAASFIASLVTLWTFLTEGSLATIRVGSYSVDALDLDLSLWRGLARTGAGNTMALWLAIGMLWQTTTREGRTFWIVAILWFGILSLFALRREVLVTVAAGLAWLFWRYPGRVRRYTIFFSAIMVAGSLFFILVSPEWMSRLLEETVEEFYSGEDSRTVLLLRFTPAAFMASPLFGYGPGNYEITQFRFSDTVTSQILFSGGVAAHNSWSSVAIEAGAGALVGFCLLLWGVGKPLFKSLRTPNRQLLALWSIAPLVFFQLLMSLFFGDALRQSVTWFWFGVLLALERLPTRAST